MRAVTMSLDAQGSDDVDLNDIAAGDGWLFVRDGVGFAGRGIAVETDDPLAIVDILAAIDHRVECDVTPTDADMSPRPMAFGAIDFVPGRRARFVIPEVVVAKATDGRRWITRIDDAPLPSPLAHPRPQPSAQQFTIRPLTPVDTYLAAVAGARNAVASGRLAKAVIARQIEVVSDQPIDVHAVLLRLKASFGSSYRYSFDGLIGASPELLVSVVGNTVSSHPLAGTAPRTGDAATDQLAAERLVASTKDQIEHRVVIDVIHDTLLPWCSYLDWEPEPSVIAVANVQHLATAMEGHLSDPRPDVVQLAMALSPTPALGGFPRGDALDLIATSEGFDRGRYGGAIGWVDSGGDGTWCVAIRCAELTADRRGAILTAGGGIVAASNPSSELAETQAKLQAMLSAIVRP